MLLYACSSLAVVRMVAVGIAMLGSHSRLPTIAFIGWFGPRGIASVLYSFLLIESVGELDVLRPVVDVVTLTVALSVLLHGMTATPLARAYGRWFGSMAPEHDEMIESTHVHEHHLGRSSSSGHPSE
jgi:NhaP-type Na+/H+ or K+/H+ antiporter